MNQVTRTYAATVDDVSNAERMVVAKINTGAVDRYRTVIDPAGVDLKQYRANPVVLWEHGKDPSRGAMPVGKNVGISAIKARNGSIVARTQFGKDDYSQALFEMYRDELLRGWSVNILPVDKDCSPPTKEERRARPELDSCEMMYRSSELAEYSAVAIPGNAEALTMMERRGIWFPAEARTKVSPQPPISKSADGDDEVTESGGRFHARGDDDNPDGYATREEAQARCDAMKAPTRTAPAHTVIDVRSLIADRIDAIDRHYSRRMDAMQAAIDLMRGRV